MDRKTELQQTLQALGPSQDAADSRKRKALAEELARVVLAPHIAGGIPFDRAKTDAYLAGPYDPAKRKPGVSYRTILLEKKWREIMEREIAAALPPKCSIRVAIDPIVTGDGIVLITVDEAAKA